MKLRKCWAPSLTWAPFGLIDPLRKILATRLALSGVQGLLGVLNMLREFSCRSEDPSRALRGLFMHLEGPVVYSQNLSVA